MIAPTSTTNVSATVPGGLAATAARTTQLGQQAFLELLVAQLKNQDPLSPLQPHEFAAQLAQFASVEQLTELNAGLVRQSESAELAALIGQTTLSASLLGRQVVADGDQVTLVNGTPGSVRVEVGTGGGRGTLELFDKDGRKVASRDLGTIAGGRQTLTLPNDLPPGTWRYTLSVTGADDHAVAVTTFTSGIVDGLHFQNGQIVLRIGSMEVPLEAIAEIGAVPTPTSVARAASYAAAVATHSRGGQQP